MKKLTKKDLIYIVIIATLTIAIATLSLLLYFTKNPKVSTEYYDKKCEVFETENGNFAHGQTVFIGDSITDGCALDVYYSDLPGAVYNRGIGGDSTGGVLKRLKLSLFDINPSRIVLMIGINDINGLVPKAQILKNYSEILSKIKTNLPEAEVICVSILPVNLDLEGYTMISAERSNATAKEINPEIEKLAASYGYGFVNMFDAFCDEDGYLIRELSPDGIHLNHEGYIKYSSLLKDHLADRQ